MDSDFEWDQLKNIENTEKHGVAFEVAQFAIADPKRLIFKDTTHNTLAESRYYCLGKIDGQVCTVRFTYRNHKIRIFGAGF